MKKYLKIIIIIVIIVFSYLYFLCLKNSSNRIPLSKFKPFYEEYENLDIDTIKVNTNLPKIDAASAFYPLASSIVQCIYDKDSYNNELSYDSTSETYKNLLDEKVDIIIVTSPSENQQKMIEQSNMTLKFIPIAKEALIFYTREQNIVDSLTTEDIKNIYTDQITNWNELNGSDSNIKTYQLAKDNGSQTCFENIVKNNTIDKKNHFEVYDMGTIIDKVAWNNNSIGYAINSFYTKMYNNPNLKLLSINQIEPNAENIVLGKYPLMHDVYFVYNENNNNSNISNILNWILSEQGQKLVQYMGLQPINN